MFTGSQISVWQSHNISEQLIYPLQNFLLHYRKPGIQYLKTCMFSIVKYVFQNVKIALNLDMKALKPQLSSKMQNEMFAKSV